tara:strand:+ start:322 stop:426 length:105 start_codon:yes stop_codon:yes gene_type:complete
MIFMEFLDGGLPAEAAEAVAITVVMVVVVVQGLL